MMIKKLLLPLIGSALTAFSFAGHMEFISSQVTSTTYTAVSLPWVDTISGSATGKVLNSSMMFHLNASTGTWSNQAMGSVFYEVKVKWVPDPGDPLPLTADAWWDLQQDASAYWFWPVSLPGVTGSAVYNLVGQSIPFVTSNFSELRTWAPATPSPMYSSSSSSIAPEAYGGFGFQLENGDWVGTATIEVSYQMGIDGSSSSNLPCGPRVIMSLKMTLVKAGIYDVI